LGVADAALAPAFPAICAHRARKGGFHFETQLCFAQATDFVDAGAMRKILEFCISSSGCSGGCARVAQPAFGTNVAYAFGSNQTRHSGLSHNRPFPTSDPLAS
jgi:hypothetical protein